MANIVFSVIVPTYHRNDLLAACLACLNPDYQSLTSGTYEVIVTDDGSDSTAKKLISDSFPWVHWVKGPQRGPAANRNSGAKKAQGKWLIFTDDDCLPDPELLQEYHRAVQEFPCIHVFEGKTIANRPQERYDEESPINEYGGNLWSCNFCISRQIFEQINGFDELFKFAAMEDVDLFARLQKIPIEHIFRKSAVVVHPFRRTDISKFRKQYWSFQYFLVKHNQINYKYRLGRFKYLIKSFIVKGLALINFKFIGWKFYVYEHIFLITLIFIKDCKVHQNNGSQQTKTSA